MLELASFVGWEWLVGWGYLLVVAAHDSRIHTVAGFLLESWIVALLLVVIIDFKVAVPPFAFPLDFMLSQGEGCCCV